MDSLVRALLAATPPAAPAAPAEAPSALAAWRAAIAPAIAPFTLPVDRALVAAAMADRLGFAFIGGYTEALRALVPTATDALALCATEEAGNQPRAIRTTLSKRDAASGDEWVVTGKKKWATGASSAGALLVVASVGVDDAGKNRLRVVRVPTSAPGVRMTSSAASFVPEIDHAEIVLDHVAVTGADILPGDGYDDYLKPFRTVEDAHVHAALAGYLLGVARRHNWPDLVERMLALALAARVAATAEPTLPTTHVALAGVLALAAHEVAELETRWRAASDAARGDAAAGADAEWLRWQRDRPLLKTAAAARAARRDRAWQLLKA